MEMHDIAPHQQLLTVAAVQQIGHMTGGMAMAVDGLDAARQRFVGGKPVQLARGGIGRHRCARQPKGKAQRLRRAGFAGRVQPIGRIGLRQPYRGLGEGHGAVGIEQPTHMVRVGVGQQHFIDLGRVMAGGAQIGQHLAQARAKALRGAGVDQAQVVAALYQIGIDCGLQALGVFGHVAVIEQAGDRGRVHPDQRLPAQCHGAVEQGGDVQLPDLLVVDAGNLLLRRGLRAAGRGVAGDSQAQDGQRDCTG